MEWAKSIYQVIVPSSTLAVAIWQPLFSIGNFVVYDKGRAVTIPAPFLGVFLQRGPMWAKWWSEAGSNRHNTDSTFKTKTSAKAPVLSTSVSISLSHKRMYILRKSLKTCMDLALQKDNPIAQRMWGWSVEVPLKLFSLFIGCLGKHFDWCNSICPTGWCQRFH